MIRLYLSLFAFLPFAPLVIAVLGAIISLRLSRRRWLIDALTFAAMLLALPVYIHLQGVLDPTTVLYPGPGDGFIVLLYLAVLIPSAVGYSIFCYVSRTRPVEVRTND